MNGLRLLTITLVAFAIPSAFGQTPTTPQQKSALTSPAQTADKADIAVTEVSSGVYSSSVLHAGVQIGQMKVDPVRGFVLDNSGMFIDKRIIFKGDMREFVREVDGAPATSSTPRIVTAAHRDYNPLAAASSLGLSEVGVVDVDTNGFVRSPNAKSGWVNKSVTVGLQDGGRARFVHLSNVTFWIGASGREWLAFSVGSASVSDDEKAPGSAINVLASVAGGKALLRVGQHRLRLDLPALTDKLGFVDENQVTLNDASRRGDLDMVKAILTAEPDSVSSKDTTTGTALMNAAIGGHRDVAQFLLAHKAQVDGTTGSGQTALILAAVNGQRDVAAILLQNGANVNAKMNGGSTALILAASSGHKDVAELLLANGADVSVKDGSGVTPLHLAASNGHKDIAELLLAGGADLTSKDTKGATPLHYAAAKGHEDVAELLLGKGSDVNAKDSTGATPLHWAAGNGRKEMAESLLRNKADINAIEDGVITPVHMAASTKHPEVASVLKEHGGRDFIREILDAAQRGDSGTVTALLADHPSLANCADESNGWTPLHFAADADHKDVVDVLLRNKADVNARSKDGRTPLVLATSRRHKDVEKLLRQQGGR